MSNLPDNFNTAAFDAFLGCAKTDRAEAIAATAEQRTRELNMKAAAILRRARAEIVALGDFEWATRGYDLVDALDLLDDLTPKVT